MPKILWVALPLLLATAWLLVWMLLSRRLPSRLALNVATSVLLVAYVSTTAGLGIFWVANQQLPVFDWHYLFGYATVLLVVLHLSFNLRIVWRFLTHRPAAAPVGAPRDVAAGRRLMFAGLGALLAAGAAFVLGLRHGRSELRIEPADAGGRVGGRSSGDETGAQALAIVERFHAFSSHTRTGALLRAPGAGWGEAPPPFKRYPGARRVVVLPAARSVAAGEGRFGLGTLADVLWHSAGVSDSRGGIKLRTAPSSGALFSTELYVAVHAVQGLAAGLWHYDASAHALEQLHEDAGRSMALGAPGEAALHEAPAVVVATAVFGRTGHKYRDRTYRYVLADLGHALENLRVAALAVGLQPLLLSRFDEARVASTLGLDEGQEGVLALMALRAAGSPVPPAPAAGQEVQWRAPAAVRFDAQAPPIGATAAVHRATSLRAVAVPPAAHTASAAAPVALPSVVRQHSPAVAASSPVNRQVLDVIARRRSVRRFASQVPLPLDALAAVLDAMRVRQAPLLSPAVRVQLVANAVHGLPAGAYRHDEATHRLLPVRAPADLRAAARAAALDQDVIGDAAVVFVLSLDRAAFAADPAGAARGYRHAFIEAGLVGERIYLEAARHRLGVCAVGAFYDEEAAALVGLDASREWVVHFAALGVPAA
jgi:SagB-type dehydrogenase family enzyme